MIRARGAKVRLVGVVGAGAGLLVLLVGFLVLHLRMPPGWSPVLGRAPLIGPVFEAILAYPAVALSPAAFRWASTGMVLGMWALYGAAVAAVAREREPAQRRSLLGAVSGLCLVMHLALWLMPPVLSTDLFFYALAGKLTLTGQNPYLHSLDTLAGDPLFPFASWQHLRNHYGPVFLWAAAGATWLGGGGPLGTALAFKALAVVCNLTSCWAVHRLARDAGEDGLAPLTLYAWNPLVLVETAGNAHSEAVMVMLALMGLLLVRRGRVSAGWVVLLASTATKFTSGVLALLVAVRTLAQTEPSRRLVMAARLSGVGTLGLVAFYWRFWQGTAAFGPALDVVWKGRALQVGVAPVASDHPVVALAVFAALLVGAVVVAARGARDRSLELSAALVTYFMLFVMWWHMPWYFVTAIALAAPVDSTTSGRALRLVTLLVGLVAMLRYGALLPTASS